MTKSGNIHDGGGWRYTGQAQGKRNRAAARTGASRSATRGPLLGTGIVHTMIDDRSVAYADETAATATGVLERAVV